jgi:hypothetical protein
LTDPTVACGEESPWPCVSFTVCPNSFSQIALTTPILVESEWVWFRQAGAPDISVNDIVRSWAALMLAANFLAYFPRALGCEAPLAPLLLDLLCDRRGEEGWRLLPSPVTVWDAVALFLLAIVFERA